MNVNAPKGLIIIASLLAALALIAGIFQPAYLSSYFYLGALIFALVLAAALWNYKARVFPLLLIIFLWAGASLPLSEIWTSRRWIVLGIAAVAGVVLYLQRGDYHFGQVHLFAIFCVVAALVSALVSSFPRQAMLKASSLFLLFVYGSTGARLALAGREGRFCARLLLACEVLSYIAAVSYFVVGHPLFGNPNSLGAIMGVVVIPALLWGILVSDNAFLQRRRSIAFALALVLMLGSVARAAIAASAVGGVLLCLSLRRYATLAKGLGMATAAALLVVALKPMGMGDQQSLVSSFLYKGDREAGVFGSRASVWDQTLTSIRQRPWFGSGFGTAPTSYDGTNSEAGTFRSSSTSTREHGSSYLAIAEGVGLLGVTPFLVLMLMVAQRIGGTLMAVYRTGDPLSPSVPLAVILAAGFVHAAFEDWMFAVGYYLCVFFWSLVFMFFDTSASLAIESSPSNVSPQAWQRGLETAPTAD